MEPFEYSCQVVRHETGWGETSSTEAAAGLLLSWQNLYLDSLITTLYTRAINTWQNAH